MTPLGVPMRFECWWGVECCLLVLVLDGGVVMVGGVWGGGELGREGGLGRGRELGCDCV